MISEYLCYLLQEGEAEVGMHDLRRKVPDVLLEEEHVPLIHCVLSVSAGSPKE